MRHRRILYVLALAAALLFQIFYDRYLARFVLVCVVSLPILSLLLALPGALCLRLQLSGSGTECRRGEARQWRLEVKRPVFLPMPRLTLRLCFHNDLTGWTEKRRVICSDLSDKKQVFTVQADHCGRVNCQVTRARLLDCLGVFAIPVRLPVPAAVLVLPVPTLSVELPDLGLMDAPVAAQGNQRIPNGDYELRDYRPGDPLRAVHWKLSSKRDELVVREWQGTCSPRVILAVDRFGDPERLDQVMDRFFALSAELLAQDRPHLVRWEGESKVCTASVSDRESLLACMGKMLSDRAPLQGTPMRELLTFEENIPYVYVTAGEEETL